MKFYSHSLWYSHENQLNEEVPENGRMEFCNFSVTHRKVFKEQITQKLLGLVREKYICDVVNLKNRTELVIYSDQKKHTN